MFDAKAEETILAAFNIAKLIDKNNTGVRKIKFLIVRAHSIR